jgi:hypothetical protein
MDIIKADLAMLSFFPSGATPQEKKKQAPPARFSDKQPF